MKTFSYTELLLVWKALVREKPNASASDLISLIKRLADKEEADKQQEVQQTSWMDETGMAGAPEGDY